MSDTISNIKETASNLWQTPQNKRNTFLRTLFFANNIDFIEQQFNNGGINFIVGDILNCNIVVSSHYDGPGMYDNAVGCIILFYLMTKRKSNNTCYALFDQEEIGCLGAKSFFSKNNHFIKHYDIGGCGIGDELIIKKPNNPFSFLCAEKKVVLPFFCDANISANYGIDSNHLFFLNKSDRLLFNSGFCPQAFFNLHTDKDSLQIISNDFCNVNYEILNNLIWEKN
jgi:hypothetical protein